MREALVGTREVRGQVPQFRPPRLSSAVLNERATDRWAPVEQRPPLRQEGLESLELLLDVDDRRRRLLVLVNRRLCAPLLPLEFTS